MNTGTDSEYLPKGWTTVPLQAVVTKLVDGSHNPPSKQEVGRPMLSARNIANNQIVFNEYRFISEENFAREHARTRVSPGDVLLTMVGTIGRSAVVSVGSDRFALQRSVAVMTPMGVLPKYLMYQFQAPFLQRHFEKNARGTAQKGIYLKTLGQTPIVVAPLSQQELIVAEIEKQFSRLDEAVTNLKRIKANLKRYRAAVLKAAVEGKLTEEWRKQHPDVEPASKLLDRILAERQTKWKGKGKYKEPPAPQPSLVLAMPDSWVLATAEQCTSMITDGEHITPQRAESGVLLLSARNILDGRLSLADVDYVPRSEYDRIAKRLIINPDDVLLSCSGTVGRSTVAPENLEFTLVRSVAVLKPLAEMGKYLCIALRSPILQEQVSEKKTQTAQANIFQGKIRTLIFPLPPLAEQQRIVAEVERHLSIIEQLELAVKTNLKRADRLRQAILTRAFAGKLVNPELKKASASSHEFPVSAESRSTYRAARRERRSL